MASSSFFGDASNAAVQLVLVSDRERLELLDPIDDWRRRKLRLVPSHRLLFLNLVVVQKLAH